MNVSLLLRSIAKKTFFFVSADTDIMRQIRKENDRVFADKIKTERFERRNPYQFSNFSYVFRQ